VLNGHQRFGVERMRFEADAAVPDLVLQKNREFTYELPSL
jgi:hypothetical protein